MNEYKFRAEAQCDVGELLKVIPIEKLTIVRRNVTELEVHLFTKVDAKEILNAIMNVPDGHVMYRTLNSAKAYTGEVVRNELFHS